MTDTDKLRERYGASERGNFYVKDTVGVPHPYCITPKHVAVASDRFGGMLGEAAIEAAEKQGAKCGICRGELSFAEHELALLIGCKAAISGEDNKAVPELHEYLLKCKPLCEADKFAGFAFVKEF